MLCVCVHACLSDSECMRGVSESVYNVCVLVDEYIWVYLYFCFCVFVSLQASINGYANIWLCVYIRSCACVFRICPHSRLYEGLMGFFSCTVLTCPCMNMYVCYCICVGVCELTSLAVIKFTAIQHVHINLCYHGGQGGDSVRQISLARRVSVYCTSADQLCILCLRDDDEVRCLYVNECRW